MLVRYRVDDLAARSGVSVDTVRFYQGRGLLGPPRREGRIGWYSDEHLERLARIRELKARGLTLGSIARLLERDLDPADEALVAALAAPAPGRDGDDEDELTLADLAKRTGVPLGMLEAIEREGLLVPEMRDGRPTYTESDARAVAAGVKLLEAGLPLSEVLELAHAHEAAMRAIAERAVELFDRHVRRRLRDEHAGPDRIVEAFRETFPATVSLVAHHFGRLLLQAARERAEREAGRSDGART
jgi:DNA-binding transcriptional MerR regulator